ncbi:CPSF A subunit region-domain-containing protein [Cantharellus anzutake]|uniref:CPSF A subunit region-domain-containing protein n=1 Tax=Cantharellus anzutake TaxID=1750568 RepID=UPI00190714A0|nr:CPSF A subunit region-domain-containing protein [Cantharellus anzutake]KAF8331909.1 CPSF A subunit region-domain-containing protein [Cantharellus anzutake]
MHLYHLTLQPPTVINQTAVGNFSGTRQQEIIVARGSRLELLRPDANGKVTTVLAQDAFASIRSLSAFRLTGGTKDYIVIGSDAGRIVILEYDAKNNAFNKLQQETFGKSGARRIVPGQYLAVDPKGRAVMIGAVEKAKLVYILNRDAAANLTISSPLEAHKNHAIIHHLVAVDVGFENPMYAALEVDYSESDRDPTGEAFNNTDKMLTFYELDLGLNHVVRKWSEPTDPRANLLVQVPGGQSASTNKFDGPSGVLICCEDHIIYRHMDHEQHRVPIPRRLHPLRDPERGLIIVSAVMHKMKGAFFFLLHSEEGDLYKVTIDHEDEEVKALKIKYFDTVPISSSLCILKSGFLFVASEFGNHHLYQFQKLGDDDEETEFTSTDYPKFGMEDPSLPLPLATFKPRALENLALVDELESLDPIIDGRVANLLEAAGETPQVFTACGRGPRSTFRMLRHGLEAEESVSSDLPGIPNAVWTTKLKEDDQYDSYIILSFVNGTLVLSVGETIEEVSDTGLLSSAPTLAVQQIGVDALLQVYPHGIRHVLADRRVNEWKAPQGRTIVAATTNKRQVVVALSSAELVYFELDLDGQLNEYQDRKPMGSAVLTMSIAEVPQGRQRTPYLAVGCEDQTVRIVSLDPESTLDTISLQALTAQPASICIAEMLDASIDKNQPTTFVNIGLVNGVLLRTVLDPIQGSLTDTRTRFLGTRPVKLVRIPVHGTPSILALSSRSWLNYTYQNLLHFTPLIFENLDYAWSFSAELSPDGLIGISGNMLRIFQIPKLGDKLKERTMPLLYTPRRFISHPTSKLFYMIETDHRTLSPEAEQAKLKELAAARVRVDEEILNLPAEVFGRPKAEKGRWASCLRIIDPVQWASLPPITFGGNEAAFSLAVLPFNERNELHLVIGTARDTFLAPRSCSTGVLRTYRLLDEGRTLEFLHETEVDDVPTALVGFRGRLLAGVGKALRIYDIGKKKLLRKCENKSFASAIMTLNTQGYRIIVGDAQDSLFYCVYKPPENRLLIFADDTQPRWITSATMMDYETVAGGDKFGNVFINRLPASVTPSVDDDPTGAGIMHEKSILMGAPHKTILLAHFHIGDIPTSLQRVALVPGGREVLLYTGLMGSIGLLVPFVSKEDIEFMTTLEQHMRTEGLGGQGGGGLSLLGRDQMAYRGYYAPVKAVVDGDLCERFAMLPAARQAAIAGELDRTVGEVLKKLEGLRVSASGV